MSAITPTLYPATLANGQRIVTCDDPIRLSDLGRVVQRVVEMLGTDDGVMDARLAKDLGVRFAFCASGPR